MMSRRKIKSLSDEMHGGEVITDTLARHGVKHIFTLCGGHISPILVACKQKGIRVIDVRDEVTAVFAADAVSRLSDSVGVAVVTAGPGVTNTITAVKNAQLAQSPVIVLGGATASILKGKGALQDIDQMALFKPHVKWSSTTRRFSCIVQKLEKAFAVAQSRVPGPVFIEFPVDLLYPEDLVRNWYGINLKSGNAGLKETLFHLFLKRHVNRLFAKRSEKSLREQLDVTFPVVSNRRIAKVATLLKKSKKPVMLIGSQALLSTQQASRLQDAVRTLAIPTYLSGLARGLLSKHDAFYFRHKRKEALRESDLVILAGVPCDFRLDYGRHINRTATLVSINRSREDLKKNKRPDVTLHADPAIVIQILAKMSEAAGNSRKEWTDKLSQRETERENEITSQANMNTDFINPLLLCQQIEANLDENSIIVVDGGDFVATASYIIRPRGYLSWLDPGPFGTLGVGAGFAMGAKICHPDAELWILYGDGSAAYSLAEWDTFVRHSIPVIALVGNDAGWNQIAREQVNIFDDDVGTTLTHTDYHEVAKGYGGEGLFLHRPEDVGHILQKAKALAKEGKPVLINALIGKTDFRKGSISM